MSQEHHPVPHWVVVSAGTGGTSATIGRYIRYRAADFLGTKLCVVDPENSVFFDHFHSRDRSLVCERGSRIEGIGRPRVEPSFLPEVIDRMLKVPDAASIATIRWLEGVLGRKCGGSTGTNLYGTLTLAAKIAEAGESGSLVSMICDPGERYLHSYYSDDWIAQQGLDLDPYLEQLQTFQQTGTMEALRT